MTIKYFRFSPIRHFLPACLSVTLLGLLACMQAPADRAQTIVDQAIEAAGGKGYDQVSVQFDFRNRSYRVDRDQGRYEMVRSWQDSTGQYSDVLTNDGFERTINGQEVEVHDTMAFKYSNSINSVIYFALLPQGLNDAAVNKAYLGEEVLDGVTYDKIRVTFDQEGGGTDYQDIFLYWFNQDTKLPDFLAYKYETDGGGMRFRKAYNERYVGGIRFVDYENLKPTTKGSVAFADIGQAYDQGKLTRLSLIETENIQVERL